jgi:hypothetical protein
VIPGHRDGGERRDIVDGEGQQRLRKREDGELDGRPVFQLVRPAEVVDGELAGVQHGDPAVLDAPSWPDSGASGSLRMSSGPSMSHTTRRQASRRCSGGTSSVRINETIRHHSLLSAAAWLVPSRAE